MAGVKNRCSSASWVLSVMPVASKSSALNLPPSGASAFHTDASSPAPAAPERRSSTVSVAVAMPAPASDRAISSPRPPPGAAPTSARPASTGSPGVWRSSGVGTGSPTLRATRLPTVLLTIWV